jgi:ribosomal protein L33
MVGGCEECAQFNFIENWPEKCGTDKLSPMKQMKF